MNRFFIFLSTFLTFIPAYGQITIMAVDNNGKSIKNEKIIISQDQIDLERYSDSTGMISFDSDIFDITKPIKITPKGYKTLEQMLNGRMSNISFAENTYELDPIILKGRKTKEITFKNYKEKENRFSNYYIRTAIRLNAEHIINITEFAKNSDYGAIKSISFDVKNRQPNDTSFVYYRLNLYNKEKNIIYSKDQKFQINKIDKDLVFEISPEIFSSQVAYVGIRNAQENTTIPYENSPIYQILFENREFQSAKGYIQFYDKEESEWQLISSDNDSLEYHVKHTLTGNPSKNLTNYNLNIEIVCTENN
ncbi:hypothetical protein [Nonlabens arenilitoris]|uniref:hypothetical protein n=1 Tax=Nonlabens arenilitoris TaxID=1217969 RepID=UPI0011B0D495|nr:hypothetical protein [Nonlabens arenilitoris]